MERGRMEEEKASGEKINCLNHGCKLTENNEVHKSPRPVLFFYYKLELRSDRLTAMIMKRRLFACFKRRKHDYD